MANLEALACEHCGSLAHASTGAEIVCFACADLYYPNCHLTLIVTQAEIIQSVAKDK